MSTKIYNGYLINTGKLLSVFELVEFMAEVRKRAHVAQELMVAEHMARVAARYVDSITLKQPGIVLRKGDIGPKSPSMYAFSLVSDTSRKSMKSSLRDEPFDYSFNVSILPTHRHNFALLYSQCREFTEVWQETPGVQEYGYWNNTDQPENISDGAWRRRKRNWDRALRNGDSGAESGFTFELAMSYLPFPKAVDLADAAPTKEERAKQLADELLMIKWMKAAKGDGTQAYWDARDKARSDEGKAEAESVKQELMQTLLDITSELLKTSMNIPAESISPGEYPSLG